MSYRIAVLTFEPSKLHPLEAVHTKISMSALLTDLTDYPLNCSSEEALKWFNDGILAYVSFRENGLPSLDRSLEVDDSLILAHCILVIIHTILSI